MRKRISPSTIIAGLALFFSLTGAGLAAGHYLITSKSQIAPWVLHSLRGARGPRGLTGAQGATGVVGTDPAPAALSNTYTVVSLTAQVSTDARTAGETAACDPSDDLVSGGLQNGSGVTITNNAPWPNRIPLATPGHNAWIVQGTLAPGATSGTFQAWALCARAS